MSSTRRSPTNHEATGTFPAASAGPPSLSWRAVRSFYALPEVRLRLVEYLGGPSLDRCDAVYVTRTGRPGPGEPVVHPPSELPRLLDRELSAARSLWDRRALLVQLDLEHVHFDRPGEPLAHRATSRRLQRPVIGALESILDDYRIPKLRLLTGRGQHIVWRLDRSSRAVAALTRLGNPERRLRTLYRERRPPADLAVGELLGAAHEGLGKIVEYLGHLLLERCVSAPVPVKLTAVNVGPGPRGREIVSFDLSQFGDPLYCRSTRMPFTLYRKYEREPPNSHRATPFVVLPIIDGDERHSLEATVSLDAAREIARSTSTAIPEAAGPSEGLIADYLRSDLCRFHREFDASCPEPAERWADSYDRLELDCLPGCLANMLRNPNDLLLQPAAIQHLVRGLTALGWESRQIAGLLRSKYERDHSWIQGIHFYEAGIRADFYTRLFAGLAACGRDSLIDFNCRSADEKWLCTRGRCEWDLRELRERLVDGGAPR